MRRSPVPRWIAAALLAASLVGFASAPAAVGATKSKPGPKKPAPTKPAPKTPAPTAFPWDYSVQAFSGSAAFAYIQPGVGSGDDWVTFRPSGLAGGTGSLTALGGEIYISNIKATYYDKNSKGCLLDGQPEDGLYGFLTFGVIELKGTPKAFTWATWGFPVPHESYCYLAENLTWSSTLARYGFFTQKVQLSTLAQRSIVLTLHRKEDIPPSNGTIGSFSITVTATLVHGVR